MPTCQQFYYKTHGTKENSAAILLLHGFLGNCEEWSEVANILKEGFFCIVPDLPGHGRTMPRAESDYTMPAAAKALLTLLNQEEVERCILVGYSMGGRLALYLTLNHPGSFSKLILESASPGLKTKEEQIARVDSDNSVIKNLQSQTIDEFLSDWYSQPMFESIKQDSTKFEELLKRRSKNKAEGLSKSLKFMGSGVQPSLWNILHGLKPPTLLIVGANDNKFKSIADEMKESSAAIRVVTIESAGHNVHFEKPREYVIKLQEFLI